MKKYKILIFDLDDTLIDNYNNSKYAFKKTVEFRDEIYSDIDFEKWYKIDKQFWKDRQDNLIKIPDKFKYEVGKRSEEFLNWLRAQRFLIYYDNKITLEEAINLNNIYMTATTENIIPIDGAYETLQYLFKKGYKIVIATNGPSIACRDKISKIGCESYIHAILSADMFGHMKPLKGFFEGIEKTMGNHNVDEYLIIGDSLKSDVGFAQNCGVDSCWFNRNNEQLNSGDMPTIIVNNLIELIDLL